MSYKEEQRRKRRRQVAILRALGVIIGLIILAILGIIFFKIMSGRNEDNKKEQVAETVDTATVADAASKASETDIPDESEVEFNGDKVLIDPDSWLADKTIYDPVMTEATIHLPSADMEKFDQVIADSAGSDNSSEDSTGGSAWETVMLTLDNVDGSINNSPTDAPRNVLKTQTLISTYMILVDLDNNTIVAERDCDKVVSPASMTKILTVLTARDYIDETTLNDKFVITDEITEYVRKNNCSAVGFTSGTEVTVRDLMYGTILPSGADAALGLAEFCCGSQEAFVEAMNKKVEELGLSDTAHFTNVVGVYDEELHCTMKDMSVILGVAVQDDLLRDVLSKRTYTTDATYIPAESTEEGTLEEDVPEEDKLHFEVSNWFLRRIEDKEMNGNVIAAKTGFVNEAGCCAASYYEANNGKKYLCVTGNAYSSWRAIYDHVCIYRSLTP